MTRPLGIIRNLKNHIHGNPYITTFIVIINNVIESNYYMLLRKPWFKDVKVTHDWGNNLIIVQNNVIIIKKIDNMKLGAKTRRSQILVYYDLMEGLTYEEED